MRQRASKHDDLPESAMEILRLRAERVRAQRTDESADEESTVWLAEFAMGEGRYALPLKALRAALPLRTVTPIPLSAPHVVGILRFQGEILAALSFGSLLNARGWRKDPAVLLVVDSGHGRLTALDCEEIPKAVVLPASQLEQARGRSGFVQEIITSDRRALSLVDLSGLLAAVMRGTHGS